VKKIVGMKESSLAYDFGINYFRLQIKLNF